METVVQPQSQHEEELRLLLDWDWAVDRRGWRRAGSLSIALHILAVAALTLAPREVLNPPREEVRRITPLVAPPNEPTQRAPNRGKVSKEFNIEALLPRPRILLPSSPPSSTRAAAPAPPIPAPRPSVAPLPEPPKIDVPARENQPKLAADAAPPPLPQIQTREKPKLAFETPSAPPAATKGQGIARTPAPGSMVDEALRSLAHGGSSSGLVVGEVGMGPSGMGEGIQQPLSPGKQGSALELLSDPMGVDFRPYLLQILSAVRRNWFAVMPESAKLGRRGKVALQFAISRDGSVAKVVFAVNSGAEALDRAAVASISMSHPFPPLPAEFRGNQIRLQFTFQYNMPVN